MERVDLTWEYGTERQRKWGFGSPGGWEYSAVSFGRLADGRWFAQRYGRQADVDDRQQGGCVFGTDEQAEQLALRLAYSWMSEGDWWAMPASFDGFGRPDDGLPWVRIGQRWKLPD